MENPKKPYNEIVYESDDLGNYAILVNSIALLKKEVESKNDWIWHMNFDDAHSKFGKGAGIVFASPLGHIFKFAYRLEFDATNNVVEYEALLLGLDLAKDLKIKMLSIKGDYDLVILQVKNQFACKSDRLKKYRNAVWDNIEYFDALDLQTIPREENKQANELLVAASTLHLKDKLMDDKIKMEVIFKPSVLDNIEHWQVFNDERQVIRFLNNMEEFYDFKAGYKEEDCKYEECNAVSNPIPRDRVAMEQMFDRHGAVKRREDKKIDPGEFIEVNIGTPHDPKMIKIGKGTTAEERKKLINLLQEYRDVLAFSYEELKRL